MTGGTGPALKRTACGRLGAAATPRQPPLYALAGGQAGSGSVLGMSLSANIAKVTLAFDTEPQVTRRTSYLSKALAARAHLKRFRYVALAIDRAVCLERVTGFDKGGRRLFSANTGECSSSPAPTPTPASAPKVAIEFPEFVPSGATLRGTVNPSGLPTHYRFEWGARESYGSGAPVPDAGIGEGRSAKVVVAAISGLAGSTPYYYRLVAENGKGAGEARGGFTTPSWRPIVSFKAPTEVTRRSAILHAGIDPQGFGTHYRYEWGPTRTYGHTFESPTELMGVGETAVSQEIENLQGETTYYYRVVAESSEGTGEAKGAFSTLPSEFSRFHGHWSTVKLPNVEGKLNNANKLAGVSCLAITQCMAVGEYENESAVFQGLSELRNGSAWSVVAMPEKAGGVSMAGVSCLSPSYCIGVGHYVLGSGNVTLAEVWNGTEWSIQTTPNPGLGGAFTGVSCASVNECTAVGYYKPTPGETKTLAEYWNGAEWSIQSTPNLAATFSELTGVGCNSFLVAGLFEKECVASGYGRNLLGRDVAISSRWDGKEWKPEEVPLPEEEAKESVLTGVFCAPSTECEAVGYMEEKSGAIVSLSDLWSGFFDPSWQSQAPRNPSGAKASRLTGVSCNDTRGFECMAVGEYENSSGAIFSYANQWFGREGWAFVNVPTPENAKSSHLEGISCNSGGECVTVGYYENSGGTQLTLGEQFG
jgi:hypothetical protein